MISIYPLQNYSITTNQIEKIKEEYTEPEVCDILLNTDNGYHLRIHKKTNYIFFGDIDGFEGSFVDWATTMCEYFMKAYKAV